MFDSGRVQLTGTLINNNWVTGATVYGFPQGKTHACATERTIAMLDFVTEHMLTVAQGMRYMCGDWNLEPTDLPMVSTLRESGWQEIQDLHFQQTGQGIRPTCKGKTRKDMLWLSPELVACFHSMDFLDDTFPDHAVLKAFFRDDKKFAHRFLWPVPAAVPWKQVPALDFCVDFSDASPTDCYKRLWATKETQARQALPGWDASMRGRGQRLKPLFKKTWNPPPKLGRSHDPQPSFHGYDVQHSRWMKQLRRLTNYAAWAKVHWGCSTPDTLHHGLSLWKSVLMAPGFGVSVSSWWTGRSCIGLSDPGFVPSSSPLLKLLNPSGWCLNVKCVGLNSDLQVPSVLCVPTCMNKTQTASSKTHNVPSLNQCLPFWLSRNRLLPKLMNKIVRLSRILLVCLMTPPLFWFISSQSVLCMLPTPSSTWSPLIMFVLVTVCRSPNLLASLRKFSRLFMSNGRKGGVNMTHGHTAIGKTWLILPVNICQCTLFCLLKSALSW
jgi:hypothetical protein